MNLYGYQRSSIDLGPRLLRLTTFSDFIFLETARPFEANFHVEPQWDGGMNVDQYCRHANIW